MKTDTCQICGKAIEMPVQIIFIDGDRSKIAHWTCYEPTLPRHALPQEAIVPEPMQTPVQGLGDIVERIAKPIARTIDKVAGTDIEHCSACARRRALLNEKFPLRVDKSS